MEQSIAAPSSVDSVAMAASKLGPCSVRVLDSSLDEFPDLLSAFEYAARIVDRSILAARAQEPLWAKVYDRHGCVATIHRKLAISAE